MTSLSAHGIAIAGRLEPTDLAIEKGQMVAVVGPNGGGKTSLLRGLAQVEHAKGCVTVDGEQVDLAQPARRRQLLSFMPASRDLNWPIAVRDVIALGQEQRDDDRIDQLLDSLELGQLADRPVNQLSTGERTRVLMARAWAANPKLLLLDEPLSNLDPYWVLRFLTIFRSAAEAGQSLLVAVHDLALLPEFDRVLLVADGKVQMDETPADLLAGERFLDIFRLASGSDGRWIISPSAVPRSLP
ncbi:ABC transporter ATP-binding protein [Sphingomonas xanthus]|uniref:ATP-binding cassette domain-containing protein n=1 Tax=Sphingomonas xanthus TaxID=2594473 RepID=A0A516IP09_9SPHN|nr:ATP-binding cassette domain-containing protein [Sphingomonas xanthus]QDP18619.1 ATP-binding cassette domain-containing protein [Sphingomonas xanthus]